MRSAIGIIVTFPANTPCIITIGLYAVTHVFNNKYIHINTHFSLEAIIYTTLLDQTPLFPTGTKHQHKKKKKLSNGTNICRYAFPDIYSNLPSLPYYSVCVVNATDQLTLCFLSNMDFLVLGSLSAFRMLA